MIPVKDNPHLYRDETSGAIINCDDRAYNEYVNTLHQREHQKIEIDALKISTKKNKFNFIFYCILRAWK